MMHIKHKWSLWTEPDKFDVQTVFGPVKVVVQERQCEKCRRLHVRKIKARV